VKSFFAGLLLLLMGLALSGCAGARPADRPDFVPIRPDATATPPDPATTNTAPTPVVPDQISRTGYTHFSNRFSIDYPANWERFERPDGVVFLDPGGHAGYSVFFSDVGKSYTQEELNQYLATFVAKNFAEQEAHYAPLNQETRPDGSIIAQFSSTDPHLGPALNEVRLSQKDTFVYVVFISAAEEQWPLAQERFHQLADTLKPLDTTPAVAVPPTDEPPVWVLVGPTGQGFAFMSPSDWQITRQDETSVVVTMPDNEVTFEASVSEQNSGQTAATAAEAYVADLKKMYKDLQSRPTESFQLDQVKDGATVDFLYTTADGVSTAGSIITAVNQGQTYRVIFSASAKTYPYALEWFNPMYKSFRILPAEDIIPLEK
jgi:hypothetical protein